VAAGDDDLPDIDPAALARAEAALAALAGSYLAWADADAARLAAGLEQALCDSAGLHAHLPRLFRVAHDIKGQAATFGYPLVSDIAQRLCRVLQDCLDPDPSPGDADRISAHVGALVRAISLRLAGDGGETGRHLLASLPE
jgi:HPt (histidine-containing phosphotransfer) domain-containing protein